VYVVVVNFMRVLAKLIKNGSALMLQYDKFIASIIDLEKSFEVIKKDIIDNKSANITNFYNGFIPEIGTKQTLPYEIGFVNIIEKYGNNNSTFND